MKLSIRYSLENFPKTQKKNEYLSIHDGPVLTYQTPDGSGHIDRVSIQKWSDLQQCYYDYTIIALGEQMQVPNQGHFETVVHILDAVITPR